MAAKEELHQNSEKKVVKPVLAHGQVLGKQDAKLVAVDIQELNNENSKKQPILKRFQPGSCALVQNGKERPLVVLIHEVQWSCKKEEVHLRVNRLFRASDIQGGAEGSPDIRQVLYSQEIVTINAKNVMHPCKVFFLLEQREPVAMASLAGRKVIRPRPGHLCWRVHSPKTQTSTPFSDLPPDTPTHFEVARLLQRSFLELRKLEGSESLPPAKCSPALPEAVTAVAEHAEGARKAERAAKKPGPEKKAAPTSLEQLAVGLAMRLELGSSSTAAWAALQNEVKELLEAAKLDSGKPVLPAESAIERVARAFADSPPEMGAKLAEEGLDRLLAAWLRELPADATPTVACALLRALRRCSREKALYEFVGKLAGDSPEPAVRREASALKLHWRLLARDTKKDNSTSRSTSQDGTSPSPDVNMPKQASIAEEDEQVEEEGKDDMLLVAEEAKSEGISEVEGTTPPPEKPATRKRGRPRAEGKKRVAGAAAGLAAKRAKLKVSQEDAPGGSSKATGSRRAGSTADSERSSKAGMEFFKQAQHQRSSPPQAAEQPTTITIFVGKKQRRKTATFDVPNRKVHWDGAIVSPEQFLKLTGRKGSWEEEVFVEGDEQGRTLAEWLQDRCRVCDLPTDEPNLLLCSNDACNQMYHTYCLTPPLAGVPRGDWFCPDCSANGFGSKKRGRAR